MRLPQTPLVIYSVRCASWTKIKELSLFLSKLWRYCREHIFNTDSR